MPSELHSLFEHLLPEALERMLESPLMSSVPRKGDGGRFRITAVGRFVGRSAADLFTGERLQAGASVIFLEQEVVRILHFSGGYVVGADSNVLFERLGRLLHRSDLVTREDEERLVDVEEREGVAAAAALLPAQSANWGLERRVREIACGLWYMPRGHYVAVEGQPVLGGLPRFALPPVELAMEGLRRYDEWRNRSSGGVDAPVETRRLVEEYA